MFFPKKLKKDIEELLALQIMFYELQKKSFFKGKRSINKQKFLSNFVTKDRFL